MSQRIADFLVYFSLISIGGHGIAGIFIDINALEGVAKIVSFSAFAVAILILIILTLYCIGQAIDMKKGTERNLWIISLFFVSFIATPYFYFKYISSSDQKKPQAGNTSKSSRCHENSKTKS